MAYLDNALRKIAKDKGYTVGYDDATKQVTVENPKSKKKISFLSGQGAEYGIGGTKKDDGSEWGYNVVSDVGLLDKSLAPDPPKPAYQPFESGVNYLDNALRTVANNRGYTVGYDDATKQVTVENPQNSKKISFLSGQGSQYGIGGTYQPEDSKYGYNLVSDTGLLDKALGYVSPQQKAEPGEVAQIPKESDYFGVAANKYNPPYNKEIDQFVQSIVSHKPYDYSSYDPAKDPAFQQFKKSAIQSGNEAYADAYAGTAIPGVAESSIGRQIADTARKRYVDQLDDAVMTYAEKARQDYERAQNRDYDALNAIMGTQTSSLKNTGSARDILADEADTLALANYENIQAEINRREAANPDDPVLPFLKAARQGKIFKQEEEAKIAAQADAEAKYKQARAEAEEALALAKTENEAMKIRSDAEKALRDYALDIWKASGIATKEVSDMLGVPVGAKTADYDIKKISTEIDKQEAATRKFSAETTRKKTDADIANKGKEEEKPLFDANDYYSSAGKMKDRLENEIRESGVDVKDLGYHETPTYKVIDYVFNSTLNEDEIASVLTMLGYKDSDVIKYNNYTRPNYFGEFLTNNR
jgi:hypothetical protein